MKPLARWSWMDGRLVPWDGEMLALLSLNRQDVHKPGWFGGLERDIDALNEKLAPLTSFILPGGTPAAAYLHVARTICRRAERVMVELAAKPDEPVSQAAIHYMNRLSDFLFVAARAANHTGAGDVLWVPGQNR